MSRVTEWLDRRVDGRALGIARIIVGLAALVKGLQAALMVQQFQSGDYLTFPYASGWLSFPAGMPATIVTALWIALSALFLIGFRTRVSGVLLALSIFAVIAIDQQLYSNHQYLLGTVVALLTIADAGSRYSIDARRNGGDGRVPLWALTLIKLQLTSVYLFAAITKLNGDFLSGAIIERVFDDGMRARIEGLISLQTLAVAAVATELFLALAFWFHRTRWIALPVGVGFHIANVAFMDRSGTLNLSVFAVVMLSMMVVFFTDRFARVTQSELDPEREPGELRSAMPG